MKLTQNQQSAIRDKLRDWLEQNDVFPQFDKDDKTKRIEEMLDDIHWQMDKWEL